MAELITMPKLGFNMNEGKLVKWYKQEGDSVEKGENLFSVETDKTSIDIESTADGIVRKHFIQEGDVLPVFLPIAIIADADEDIEEMINDAYAQLGETAAAAPEEEKKEKEEPAVSVPEKSPAVSTPTVPDGELRISPRARRAASARGIPLEELAHARGTGYQGGICEKDVLSFEPSRAPVISDAGLEILETTPYADVRKIIGDRLSASAQTSPHIYFTHKVNMEKLLELRKEVNGAQEQKTSVTDYIARAVILALKKYPDVNASLVDGMIEKYKTVNLGIAVAAPTGLIVPVIRNAEKMGIVEISTVSQALIEKARDGKLIPDEYSGGTFTISNLGMFGIENFTAIINPPEAAILAVSATKDQVVVVSGENGEKEIAIKPIMNITLSVDHRLIDGLLAAQFLAEVKRLLENPICLLV